MSVKASSLKSTLCTREYLTQDDICRFCWSKDAQRYLYENDSKNSENHTSKLIHKIKEVLNIDLSLLSLKTNPNKLCEPCFFKIDNFYEFKHFCQDSQRELHEILENINPESPIFNNELENTVKLEIAEDLPDIHDSGSPNQLLDIVQITDDIENVHNQSRINKQEKKTKASKYIPVKTKYYCYRCRFNLKDEENFIEHNLKEHGIEKDGIYQCFGCSKKFKTKQTRVNHERLFCPGLKDGYKCPLCKHYLPKRRIYETHMKDHRNNKKIELPEDIFKCKNCDERFKSKSELNSHMSVHSDILKKRYVCETCGRVFSRQDYLFRHKFTHTGEKRHQCPHCSFRCAQRTNLVTHIRKHTGERPYACDLCPQRCISNSNLHAHRRRHNMVPIHECPVCPKKFGYKASLQEHIEIVHEKQIQNHLCPQCGTTFTRMKALKRHLKAKHGVIHNEKLKPAG